MIHFSNVHKSYPGGHQALGGVSFDIAAGELVFVAGHSGAGKSTLLKLIAAIERPTAGLVQVKEQNVGALRASMVPYLRRNLGLIFQEQKLLFDRTVLENIQLPLLITGTRQKDAASRARAALDKVGLLDRERLNPITLSGGEQQRLAIARAIVNRPAILLADEPTANLDRETALKVMDIFRQFNQVGVTVLISTHDESLLHALNPRVLRLAHGALVESQTSEATA
ncbi:MAG: ATP-binding cassette domain-containing protein [Burkholderiaceae bacterium]|nr:MAG: ATP-binding cassette domain-containing protein [Burkholderiaceae bacterium]